MISSRPRGNGTDEGADPMNKETPGANEAATSKVRVTYEGFISIFDAIGRGDEFSMAAFHAPRERLGEKA